MPTTINETPSRRLRVVLADDHRVVRTGLRLLLETIAGIEVIAEADSGAELVDAAERLHPDLVLMDVVMPEMDGVQAMRRLKRGPCCPRVLILTMRDEPDIARTMIEAGVDGFLVKDCTATELAQAVLSVASGRPYFSPRVTQRLIPVADPGPFQALTPRQLEVLRLIGTGATIKQIAFQLGLSAKTVAVHRSSIMERLGISDPGRLVLYCVRHGLVDMTGPRWRDTRN